MTATLTLDTNFDGIADQVFFRSDVPVGSLGTGIGLGFHGATSMDNFTLAAVAGAFHRLAHAAGCRGWHRLVSYPGAAPVVGGSALRGPRRPLPPHLNRLVAADAGERFLAKWQGAFKLSPAALKNERVAAIAAKHLR